jgi:hypothetical protein
MTAHAMPAQFISSSCSGVAHSLSGALGTLCQALLYVYNTCVHLTPLADFIGTDYAYASSLMQCPPNLFHLQARVMGPHQMTPLGRPQLIQARVMGLHQMTPLGRPQLIQHMQNREGEVNGMDGRSWSTLNLSDALGTLCQALLHVYHAGPPVTIIADFIAADFGHA